MVDPTWAKAYHQFDRDLDEVSRCLVQSIERFMVAIGCGEVPYRPQLHRRGYKLLRGVARLQAHVRNEAVEDQALVWVDEAD